MYIYCEATTPIIVAMGLFLGVSGCAVSFPDYGLEEDTGGATNASTGGSGVGGQGGAVGGSGDEDCFNGIDDDDDGDADCEDVGDCGQHLSVPAAPLGWEGPVAITPAGLTRCGGAWADEVTGARETNYQAAPAECPCTCGAPNAAFKCPTISFSFWSGSGCASGAVGFVRSDGVCTGSVSPPLNGVSSVSGTVAPPTGGSCAPNGQTSVESIELDQRALCGSPPIGAGKTADDVCVPIPDEALERRVCIYAEGEQACPVNDVYTEQYVLFASHTDTRDCDVDCSCQAPSGGSCTGFVHTYTGSSNCTTTGTNLAANGSCQSFPGSVPSFDVSINPPVGGSCSPNARTPIGEVTGRGATTACCSLPVGGR